MKQVFKLLMVGAGSCLLAMNASAARHHVVSYKGEAPMPVPCDCNVFTSHWYVAGNLGLSRVYDNAAPNSNNSVDENGPGWDADIGYQINKFFGAEIGYSQYYNSREMSGSTIVARTTHFATHLDATGRYPVYEKLSVLGKVGAAYAYAQKMFTATGASASAALVTPYLAAGLAYELTPRVNMVGQWSFVRGNSKTGSNTLYTLGMEFAIV